MKSISEVRTALSGYDFTPLNIGSKNQAAVAIILRTRNEHLEVLFIERAHHKKDPWSGQMAFPGGRRDPHDHNVQAAAERETQEELAVSLAGAEFLGRIDELQGRHSGHSIDLVISPFVYFLTRDVVITPNYEVADTVWVPFSRLQDKDQQVIHVYDKVNNRTHPGIHLGVSDGRVVWGLTYRFLRRFFDIIDQPLPEAQLLD